MKNKHYSLVLRLVAVRRYIEYTCILPHTLD